VVVEPASGWGVEDDIIVVVDLGLVLCKYIYSESPQRSARLRQ
jgi:hypothetical protein